MDNFWQDDRNYILSCMKYIENSILNWAIRWTRITSKDMSQSQYVSKLVQALVYVGINLSSLSKDNKNSTICLLHSITLNDMIQSC